MHEQALEAERIGCKTHPQQMGMYTRKLMHDRTQVFSTRRDLNVHKALDRLCIAIAVTERTNAADALRNVNVLMDIARLDELFETTMDESDLRKNIDDRFVFNHEVEMDRLRQNRMLGSEWNDLCFCHCYSPSSFVFAEASEGVASEAFAGTSACS